MRQYTHEGPPEYLLSRDVLPFKIETDKPLPAVQTRKSISAVDRMNQNTRPTCTVQATRERAS